MVHILLLYFILPRIFLFFTPPSKPLVENKVMTSHQGTSLAVVNLQELQMVKFKRADP